MMMESKSSSEEETDRSNDEHTSTRRSYECVFCKRGFTTAQALGGHMNIHRKDRAKNRPGTNNSVAIPSLSSKVDDDEATFRSSYHPIQSYQPHHRYDSISPTHDHEVHTNYQTFFPEISWGLRSSQAHLHSDDRDSLVQYPHQYLNLFGEDPCRSLSGSSGIYDYKSKRGEDELDLELRLGHDP